MVLFEQGAVVQKISADNWFIRQMSFLQNDQKSCQAAWCHSFISTDIQEFYEVTLLNTQKSCEQKLEEVNHMAEQWEKSVSLQKSERAHSICQVEEVSLVVLTENEDNPFIYLEWRMHVLYVLK